jgi:hypothetical protein
MTTKLIPAACLLSAACSSQDPTPPRVPAGLATVHAYEESIGAAGRIAVFQDDAGRALATIVTGDDGTAKHPVTPGDMVTIANVGANVFDLTTYVDVSPGDELVIGELEPEDGVHDYGAVPVALPEAFTGAARYDIGLGLSLIDYPGATTTLHLTDRQVGAGGDFQVLALARDPAGAPLAFALTSSSASLVGTPTSVAGWRTDWDRVGFSLAGLPAGARVTARLDLLQGESGRFPGDEAAPADGARFDVPVPRGLGTEMEYELEVHEGAGAGARERAVIQRQPRGAAVALDLAQAFLPRIGQVSLEPGDDPARPTVRWTVDGDAAGADLVMLRLRWGDGAHQWTVILPPSHEGSFQLPELPGVLASWRPGDRVELAVGLVELSFLGDYRAVLRRGVEELEDLEGGERLRVSQAGGLGL